MNTTRQFKARRIIVVAVMALALSAATSFAKFQPIDPVPDGGMTAILLGMGLLGLGWMRRQARK